MAPPDGSGPRRLPTLSWDSIVDDGDPVAETAAGTATGTATGTAAGSSASPTPPAADGDSRGGSVAGSDILAGDFPDIVPVAPLTIGSIPPFVDPVPPPPTSPPPTSPSPTPAPVAAPAPSAPAPSAPPPSVPAPSAAPSSPPPAAASAPVVEPPVVAEQAIAADEAPVAAAPAVVAHPPVEPASNPSVEVRATPPQPVVAPIGSVAEPAPAAVSAELPQIREATPAPRLDPSPDVDRTGVVPAVGGADARADGGGPLIPEYRLPTVAPADQVRFAPSPEINPYVTDTVPAGGPRHRKKSGGGLKLLVTLVVLGGLVAAGIVVGRPYLFPDGWDATAEPYATAVESVTGAEYVDRFLLVPEPTEAYTDRMSNALTGDWTAESPQWRALGLVSGDADADNVTLLLDGWHHAVADRSDGQVYHDAALRGPQLDAEITRAFASAQLDQQYAWSQQQAARTLDDAAWTLAEVHRQAAATQEASPFAASVEPRATAALSFLPPVLAYEVLAPATYAAFERTDLPDPSSGADNPLRELGANGPGPLPADLPVVASTPVALEGDTITGTPVAVDRSFWYLVLAGYLDTRTAYQASEAIVESSMTLAERVANRCVYATFSGGDVQQTATLRAALETWVATVPLEMSASFTVLADGALQLTSCDPGSRFENGARFGVGRELIGWRMAETATTLAVTADGGTAADVAAAWAVVEATNVPVDLANLPFDTAPADAAAAAVTAVAGVLPPAGG